jgi:hypothetical protein
MTDATRWPLTWPVGWPRTAPAQRQRARFSKLEGTSQILSRARPLTIADAIIRIEDELRRLGATRTTLSTNLELSLRGIPLSRQSEPRDPGAAVYFTLRAAPTVFACDKWDRVADNIAAMAAHIEALRRIERYGVGSREQAFTGYRALTAGTAAWWDVLGFRSPAGVTVELIEQRYRALAKVHHPDIPGGSGEKFKELGEARDRALTEVRG